MSKFDKYIITQCISVFSFFLLVFFLVVWINRAVILFDDLIRDGLSALVFLEFSILLLPEVLATVSPLASFASTIYVTNRLSNESELIIIQATGFSPWRLARPFVTFGLLCSLLVSIFTLYLIPLAEGYRDMREAEVSEDFTGKLLKPGVFHNPISGVIFYFREIAPDGELQDIYVHDRRDQEQILTATSSTAFLVDIEGEKVVVLTNGHIQNYQALTSEISVNHFSDLTYKLDFSEKRPYEDKISIANVSTLTLLFNSRYAQMISGRPRAYVNEELHARFQMPFLALSTALVGFAAIYLAGFSRLGSGRYIVLGIFLLVMMKLLESMITKPTRYIYELWPLIYAPSVFGILVSVAMLYISARPRRIAPPID